MRSLSTSTLNALALGQLVLRALVQLQLDEGTWGFWNDIGNVVVGGVTYYGTGTLGSVSVLPSTTALSVPNFTLTLSGMDSEVLETFFDYTWHQRPVEIFLACLDPQTMDFVDSPTLVASGRIDKAELQGAAGSQATLTVMCEDVSRRLTWANPAVRSNGDQLRRSATDTFLQYVATAFQQQVYWGVSQPKPGHARLTTGGLIQPQR